MKKIEFRGKRKSDGAWSYGMPIEIYNKFVMANSFMVLGQNIVGANEDAGCILDEINPKTIGQYTGLKDKNRKEIFDGDIVQIQTSDNQILIRFVLTSIPLLEDGEKKDGIAAFDPSYKIVFHENKVCEVIGNLYDNLELWEKAVKDE